MKYLLLSFTIISNFLYAQELSALDVKGIDFTAEHSGEYPHLAGQIRIKNRHLLIRNHHDKKIFVSQFNGQITGTIGHEGNGPGEFPSRLNAFGFRGESLFILSRKGPYRVFKFENGRFTKAFPVQYENFCSSSGDTNPLAVTPTHVVVPAHPASGHLASAYDSDGKPTHFGELFFDKRDADALLRNRCLNEVLWVWGNGHLYGVLKYHPIILQFDSKFQLIQTANLSNSRLMALVEEHDSLDASRYSILPGLFYDCQIIGGELFLLASKTLFEINLNSFEIARVFTFRGVGKAFEDRDSTNRINFFTFALAEDKRDLFLGPGHSFNAELFVALLPVNSITAN